MLGTYVVHLTSVSRPESARAEHPTVKDTGRVSMEKVSQLSAGRRRVHNEKEAENVVVCGVSNIEIR